MVFKAEVNTAKYSMESRAEIEWPQPLLGLVTSIDDC